MGRSNKQTADYFPHYVGRQSRTRFILEERWGNDGYAFWFKLLELLCSSDGHYYDCWTEINWEYLLAATGVDEETAEVILKTLARMKKIDRELWEDCRVIWIPSLLRSLGELYAKRANTPQRPSVELFPGRKHPPEGITGEETPQNGETEAENGKTAPETPQPPAEEPEGSPRSRRKKTGILSAAQQALFERFYEAYPKKVDPATAERAWAKIDPPPDEAMTEKIIKAIESAKKYDSRFREKKYTPNPASWLNAKGYASDYSGGEQQNGESGRHSGGNGSSDFRPSTGFRGWSEPGEE